MSPEMLLGTGHGRAHDWWQVGLLLFELMAGRHLFVNSDAASNVYSSASVSLKSDQGSTSVAHKAIASKFPCTSSNAAAGVSARVRQAATYRDVAAKILLGLRPQKLMHFDERKNKYSYVSELSSNSYMSFSVPGGLSSGSGLAGLPKDDKHKDVHVAMDPATMPMANIFVNDRRPSSMQLVWHAAGTQHNIDSVEHDKDQRGVGLNVEGDMGGADKDGMLGEIGPAGGADANSKASAASKARGEHARQQLQALRHLHADARRFTYFDAAELGGPGAQCGHSSEAANLLMNLLQADASLRLHFVCSGSSIVSPTSYGQKLEFHPYFRPQTQTQMNRLAGVGGSSGYANCTSFEQILTRMAPPPVLPPC